MRTPIILAAVSVIGVSSGFAQVDPVELTIAEAHREMRAGRVTALQLVDAYLQRIEAFDKRGPAINAIITINPNARQRAIELDSIYRTSGFVGALHGIPVIVKDNYDTHDLPTSGGSLSLAESVPPDDAFQVRRIREAGAIVLAKSNMAEFAFSPNHTVGSRLPGHTKNPYALDRVPAGSSGGTAAAVSSSLGLVGLGTDTGNSIRGPSAHTALVGIRSTIGLTSRDGIIPLFFDRDVGGPMARTVTDAVTVLTVIAGTDEHDPYTEEADRRRQPGYSVFLQPGALRGKRLGVLREWSNRDDADPEVVSVFEQAIDDLRTAGAIIIDPVEIPEHDEIRRAGRSCIRFRYDLNNYLASLGADAPVKTLDEVIASGNVHPSILRSLENFQDDVETPEQNAGCQQALVNRQRLREAVNRQFDAHRLDGMIYPTWANPPRLIGDLNTPSGDNSQDLSPHTGFPAITVPMGYTSDSLPAGLQILGRAWDEGTIIGIAFGYEQATQHRRPPGWVRD